MPYVPHISEWVIEEVDLDFLGHLNNLAALRLFERARWDMVAERGYGFDVMMKYRQGPVLLGYEVKFLKEVRARTPVRITCIPHDWSSKVGTMTQVMESGDGIGGPQFDGPLVKHVEATFTVGFFDMDTRRLIPASPAWRQAIGDDSVIAAAAISTAEAR